ncbi:hypothetical protein ACYTFC_19310 [Streptomyces globosus]|uniref:hypothetical protein n=1 Tax=Streptomyces sp. WAC05292 TaxID=2487418 RepID=UPI000F74575D|nr:hypothetical protein [Streptomyces sp. WAC05292]RSS94754.1 hypothetical protein EF903_06015 [Streptomyces sp. WAC05292]
MRRTLGRSTAALVCVVLLAACGSDDTEEKAAGVCEAPSASEEAVFLREILQTEAFTTDQRKPKDELVRKLKRDLRSLPPDRDTFHHLACRFATASDTGYAGANFSYAWMPRTAPRKPLIGDDVAYDVNGVRVVAGATMAKLLVPCDMPGDLVEQSQKADLYTDVYFHFVRSEPDRSQAGKDKRAALTYLVTRHITDALGCENRPLEQPPTVKPLPAPTP